MTRQNDFPPETKARLAARAGYKCCYLGCGQATSGPSRDKHNTEKSNTGVAAHIYSASYGKGAKRIPPSDMPIEIIKDLSNGIWMCQTHGTYIDNDESTFTVKDLKKWKEIGENVAQKMQSFRCSYTDALNDLVHIEPKIFELISIAQQHDPSTDRYNTLDLLLYKKILQLLPERVRTAARLGLFINRHPHSFREAMNKYIFFTDNYPVEYSFCNKELQKCKTKMDDALKILANELSMSTFINHEKKGLTYSMSSDWHLSEEGELQYFKAQTRIIKLSDEFISLFDKLHKLCRDRFYQ